MRYGQVQVQVLQKLVVVKMEIIVALLKNSRQRNGFVLVQMARSGYHTGLQPLVRYIYKSYRALTL